jgi:hypothetical protein
MNWEIRAFLNPKASAQNPQPLYSYLTTLWPNIYIYIYGCMWYSLSQISTWIEISLSFSFFSEAGGFLWILDCCNNIRLWHNIMCIVQLHQNLCRSVVPSIAYIPWNSHVPSSLVCGSYWRVLRHSSTTWVPPRSSLWISSRFGWIYHDCHHHLTNRDPLL